MPKQPTIKNQDLAEEFLNDNRYKKNLLYCRSFDQFYLYKNGYYKDLPTQQFNEIVWNFIREFHPELNIKASLVSDIVSQIKWGAYRKAEEINTPYVAFEDKLYNMDNFHFEEFDRKKIALHKLDINTQNLSADIPLWQRFLATTLVDKQGKPDLELIKLVQEMFGFYLTNNLKAHQVFFLVGQGANGKSVMINVLEQMIGISFVSAMSIQTLTVNQFATSNLIGKKINICNEEESKYLKSDRFKALISGDLIDAERKHEQRFAFRPTTKYLFASNQLPTFSGINYGVKRRITIIPFNRIFRDKEQDKQLTKKLLSELSGIVNWAIEGAKKLAGNNYVFSTTKATDETIEEFENYISSALMFFREHYKIDSKRENFVANLDLYREYLDWCQENGKKPMSSYNFNRDIKNNLEIDSEIKWQGHLSRSVRGKYIVKFEHEQAKSEDAQAKEVEELFNRA